MKQLLSIFLFFITSGLIAQSNDYVYDSLTHTEKYLDVNGRLICEIKQLDKVRDKQRHVIYYSPNGQKTVEFFDRNNQKYDTLRKWTDEGKLYLEEIYTSNGFKSIDYWVTTGNISEIGTFEISKAQPKEFIVYDSTTFNKYIIAKCESDKPCYARTGVWKEYHKNGVLASEGKYLPWSFRSLTPTKDSSGVAVPVENTSFDILADVSYIVGEGYLKDGIWNYYDDKGKLIKKELYKNGTLKKIE
jgi:antitoxin component YwqK of YwqJK toxin-antitoxin module